MDLASYIEREILPELDSADRAVRLRAIECLGQLRLGGPWAERLLSLAASDADPQVKLEARRVLEELQKPDSGAPLPPSERARQLISAGVEVGTLLESPVPGERLAACLALSSLGRRDMLGRVLARLPAEKDPWTLAALARAVGTLGGAADLEALRPLLGHADPRVVSNTIEAMDAIGDELGFTLVVPFLSSPHHRVKAAALKAVYRLDREQALRTLTMMFASPQEPMRAGAIWCAGSLPGDEAEPLFCQALETETSRPHLAHIVAWLKNRGTQRAVDALAWAAAGPEPARREAAAGPLQALAGSLGLTAETLERARARYETDRASTLRLRASSVRKAALTVVRPRGRSLKDRLVAASVLAGAILAFLSWREASTAPSLSDPPDQARPRAARVLERLESLVVVRGTIARASGDGMPVYLDAPGSEVEVRFPVPLISGLRKGMLIEVEGHPCAGSGGATPATTCVEADTLRVLTVR